MAEITAALVKDLREKTGVGMMDCKAALAANDGDVDAAIDWLRAKGLAKAAKKASRVAAEGLVGVAVEGMTGAVVEVNSETDFVAKNDKFQTIVGEISALALKAKGDAEALKTMTAPGTGQPISERLSELVASIGENLVIRRTASVQVSDGVIGSYVHGAHAPGLGKIGVIVGVESKGDKKILAEAARQLAMHIAATNPVSLDLASIPPDTLVRERAILAEKNAGKPDNVLEKILDSGMKSYARENTLMDQPWVHDGSKSVSQAMADLGKSAGGDVRVVGYVRMQLGEGIEKKEDDFAAEVAKAAAGG